MQTGNLFASSGDGAIHVFRDTDGDGRADQETLFAEGFRALQGVAIQPETGAVFASSMGRIDVLRDTDGDLQADEQENLVARIAPRLALEQQPQVWAGWLPLRRTGFHVRCVRRERSAQRHHHALRSAER